MATDPKEYTNQIGPLTDANSPVDMADTNPELIKKMFVYKIVDSAKNKAFFVPGASTFLRISNDEPEFKHFETHETGGKYISVELNRTLSGYLSNTQSASFFGLDLEYENVYQALTVDFFEHGKDDRFLVTFENPLSLIDYRAKDQEIFIINQGVLEDLEINEFEEFITNTDSKTALSFTSLRSLEQNSPFTEIVPYFGEEPLWKDQKEIHIEHNQELLLERVTGYEIKNDKFEPLDVQTKTPLLPIKAYPVSTQNHLTNSMDWFDRDTVISYTEALGFIDKDGVELSTIFARGTKEFELISDMILITQSFINGFKVIAKNDKGYFDSKYRVGYTGRALDTLSKAQVGPIVSSLLSEFYTLNPNYSGSQMDKQLKATIAAMSDLIISEFSISGGNNDFHKIYLPWYLELTDGLSYTTAGDVLNIDPASLKFKLKSKYYDIDETTKIINIIDSDKHPINLTEPNVKELKYKYQLDWLPTEISPAGGKTKAFNPGAINPRSPKELNYLTYINTSAWKTKDVKTLLSITPRNYTSGANLELTGLPAMPKGALSLDAFYDPNFKNSYDMKEMVKLSSELLWIYGTPWTDYVGLNTVIDQWDFPDIIKYYTNMIHTYYKHKISERIGINVDDFTIVSGLDRGSANWHNSVSSVEAINNKPDWEGGGEWNAWNIWWQTTYKDRFKHNKGFNPQMFYGMYQIRKVAESQGGQITDYDWGKVIAKYSSDILTLNSNAATGEWKLHAPKKVTIQLKHPFTIGLEEEGKTLFNKTNWDLKLKAAHIEHKAVLKIEKAFTALDAKFDNIALLEITGMWGEAIKFPNIVNSELINIEFEWPSNSDETITVKRFAFL